MAVEQLIMGKYNYYVAWSIDLSCCTYVWTIADLWTNKATDLHFYLILLTYFVMLILSTPLVCSVMKNGMLCH